MQVRYFFQLHEQFWLVGRSDWELGIRNCLVWLAIAIKFHHKDCHFKILYWSSDATVIRGQSDDASLSLQVIT